MRVVLDVFYNAICTNWQVLAKHATLEQALDEICAAMVKKKEDPVSVRGRVTPELLYSKSVFRLPAAF